MSSSALAAGLRHLRDRLALQHHNEDSDEQLLRAFLSGRDEAAFAVLVHRHGPMVLRVCRRVLGHEQDAEDAFQAVFLVLARKAASLRDKTALVSWLHGTAYRTAMKAKQSAARRRKHEGSLGALTQPRSPASPGDELSWREVRALLDEEIARLPEIYRSVFVLCSLENLSRKEAAERLGLKERTVLSRLAEARKRLSQRLARRGVELTAVLATGALVTPPASGMPAGLLATTIKAALATAAGEELASVVSASVVKLVQGATVMTMVSKVKIATVLLLAASLLSGASAWAYRRLAVNARTPSAQPAEPPAAKATAKPATAPPQHATTEALEIQGRVLDPESKPKAGVKLYLLRFADKPRAIGVSAADGGFRFTVPASEINKRLRIVAAADGYGPGWLELVPGDKKEKPILRLVKDDVAITGRVIDLEGKPVGGAAVRLVEIRASPTEDLTPWIEAAKAKKDGSHRLESEYLPRRIDSADLPGLPTKVTTDAAGRFRLTGIGRERTVAVLIEGPMIVTTPARILTRPGQTLAVMEHKPSDPLDKLTFMTYYGANFQHAAAPTKPIVGVVRDKDTKKPLAGVTIQSLKLANKPYYGDDYVRTTTDAQGRYRLTGMPKGKGNKIMVVPSEDQPYLIAGAEVPDSFGFAPVTVDVELKRGVWVQGRISDKKTGKGLSAMVEYYALADNPHLGDCPGFEDTGLLIPWRGSQTDGSFRIVALPGPGVLAVKYGGSYLVANARDDAEGTKEDHLDTRPYALGAISYHAFARIDPPKGADSVKRDVALDPGQSFRGTVLGPDGKPLTGARHYGLSAWGDWNRTPLKSPQFTVRAFNPRRPRSVLFLHREKQLTGTWKPPKDESALVTVRLMPGATVIGRLVDKDGQPRGGAELELFFQRKDSNSIAHYFPERITTDAVGRFRLDTLLPGYHFQLRDIKGYFRFGGLRSGETKDLGDVQTKRPGE